MLILIDCAINSGVINKIKRLLGSSAGGRHKAVLLRRGDTGRSLLLEFHNLEVKFGWEYPGFDYKNVTQYSCDLIRAFVNDVERVFTAKGPRGNFYHGINLTPVLYKYMLSSKRDLFELGNRYFMARNILSTEKDMEVVILVEDETSVSAYGFLSEELKRKIRVSGLQKSKPNLRVKLFILRFFRDACVNALKQFIFSLNFKADKYKVKDNLVFFNNSQVLLGRVEGILRILVERFKVNLNIIGFSAHKAWKFDFNLNLFYLDKAPLPFSGVFRQNILLFKLAALRKKAHFSHGLLEALKDELWKNLAQYLYEIAHLCEVFDQALRILSPKLVIFTMRNMPGNCISEVAKKSGIPTLYLQEAGMFETFLESTAIVADRYVLWSDYAKEHFIRHSHVPAEKIFIAGAYDYDFLLNFDKKGNDVLKDIKPNNKNFTKTVLFFSNYFDNKTVFNQDRRQVHQAIAGVIKDFPECYLVIKLHPLEKDNLAEADFSKLLPGWQYKVVGDCNILQLVKNADLVVTYPSTAGYAAALFKKPQLIVNFMKFENFASFAKEGFAIEAYSSDELGGCLKKLLTGELHLEIKDAGYEDFIYRHLYKLDGYSTARAAGYTYEFLRCL